LTGVSLSPAQSALLAALLNDVQRQALPAYAQLVGSILSMWVNVQTYAATQPAVSPIDSIVFFGALADAQRAGTITDPVPQLQFSYDAAAHVQTLTCTGVLTDAMRVQLTNLASASPVLAALLQDVRNQAAAIFQNLAAGLVTVSPANLDTYAPPFIGVDAPRQQTQVKAQLVRAFLPLLARKLSRQLVLQTLSSSLASDPRLTEALVTDSALLSDATNPGKPLLDAFLAVGQQGVSASYYASTDGTGSPRATGLAATTATSDPTNNNPPTASAHFEGYLQVPIDGPYRFFAELGDPGAAASLRLDSPDPTALFDNPIISPTFTATNAGDEVSQFVQLKGGVAYHFTLDFSNLATHGASLLVQGETLPKGPLSQIVLYPQQFVVNLTRAKTLLSKVLQILEVTALDVREITYLMANGAQFNDLKLSALPTESSDDSPPRAARLFSQFLTLADYADLRKGPAGGSDGLVDVFQAASQSSPQEPNTPWTILANLTRRDAPVVSDVAKALGPDPHFENNIGIRRIWDALQLVQMVGIPIASLASSALIASAKPPTSPTPDRIAANIKNAVQAQYTADAWRPIAQSVFDKLRQKKRDALVAYLVQALGLENSNQLFEYFLVDPGMEPVVQTSRLRLAMSSVQTFIQRCLLDLENANAKPALNVAPSSINADWWEWMKRYRVWEANREIFLFPENVLEPELRLDKSDLFQTLESTLLQGDVTNDLVEDALLTYLKGLDVRARLDIVATYLDQNVTDASLSTLHVLGRTYSHPHEYFYRTYATGSWSAWEAVTPDIDGNHIVLAVWRGRLNLFWVTFISQPQAPPLQSGLLFGDLTNADISSAKAQQQYQLQLHWTEYLQGKWSNPIASDVSRSKPVPVADGFVPSTVGIRVSKEVADDGSEGALKVLLDFPDDYVIGAQSMPTSVIDVSLNTVSTQLNQAFRPLKARINDQQFLNADPSAQSLTLFPPQTYMFRVTSKNCDLELTADFWDPMPTIPYNASGIDATFRTGSQNLTVSFQSNIANDGTSTTDTESILQIINNFAVLPCANPVSPSPFLDANEPLYQAAGSLVCPFFYKDTAHRSTSNELTFFVQPALTEQTIVEWDGWAIRPSAPAENWADPHILDQIDILSQAPVAGPALVNPGDPVHSLYPMRDTTDWVTNPVTAVAYGGTLIGKSGGVQFRASTSPGLPASRPLAPIGGQGLSLSQLRTITAAGP
jgi:hypothetical protein